MNIAAVFIVYFGIKETLFHWDTGACRGQYRWNGSLARVRLHLQKKKKKIVALVRKKKPTDHGKANETSYKFICWKSSVVPMVLLISLLLSSIVIIHELLAQIATTSALWLKIPNEINLKIPNKI